MDVYDEISDALRVLFRGPDGTSRLRERLSALAGEQVEPPALLLLSRLEHASEPPRLSDIAGRAGLDLSTISRKVAALERRGLVERAAHPGDRRASTLRITADGRRLLRKMHRAHSQVLAEVLDDWTDAERAQFAALLRRFVDDLVTYGREPTRA